MISAIAVDSASVLQKSEFCLYARQTVVRATAERSGGWVRLSSSQGGELKQYSGRLARAMSNLEQV